MVAPNKDPWRTLIDELLAEQKLLQTPVARFSDAHDRAASPALAPTYRDLIPLSKPGPGEQYAFEVDLDSCTGCKACVAGCHSLNGLDDEETWRDVGLILGGDRAHPFQQTVTTACHHCADPGCLNGCPVLAYEKDPLTGIVRHLDDQCIGCQYCVLKCPYDVPKYNERLGIVRKCDMCHSRLAVGEAPACVQACPTQAIKIVNITTHVNGVLTVDTREFLASAPSPAITLPTTRYVSNRPIPANTAAADIATLRPQPAHWPLVFMLTLMPMAVACITLAYFLPGHAAPLTYAAWLAGATGLAASVFHLGKPLRAWRVFLGLRKSWLSREAVVFGPWFALATALAFASVPGSAGGPAGSVVNALTPLVTALPPPILSPLAFLYSLLATHYSLLTLATASVGALGVFCSAMIYIDTHREHWRAAQTFPRFFLGGAVLGLAALFVFTSTYPVFLSLLAAIFLKLSTEARALHPLDRDDDTPTPALKTAQLLTGPLRTATNLRPVFPILGGALLPLLIVTGQLPALYAAPAFILVLLGELSERALYFRAVTAPKMPGVISK